MSAVIRIEPLPSQQWSDRPCLLSFELSPSQANSGVMGHVSCHSNWAPPKPTVEYWVMSAVIRIEPLPSQQWSDRSCLLLFELSLSQAYNEVIGHVCCHSNWASPKPTMKWTVMSAVIRIEPLPSQQWSNGSCLLSFVLLLMFTPLTFSSTVDISYKK